MNRVFEAREFFPVPDGTRVAPVFSPFDINQSGLPPGAFEEASVAVGEIPPGVASRAHLHPVVSQVTLVLEGNLLVRMKGLGETQAYELAVAAGQAVLTEPMTLLQLINPDRQRTVRTLYVVTPAYVSLPGADGYDDAVVLDEDWETLVQARSPAPRIDVDAVKQRRLAALARLHALKAQT
jgi:hypothetical protein